MLWEFRRRLTDIRLTRRLTLFWLIMGNWVSYVLHFVFNKVGIGLWSTRPWEIGFWTEGASCDPLFFSSCVSNYNTIPIILTWLRNVGHRLDSSTSWLWVRTEEPNPHVYFLDLGLRIQLEVVKLVSAQLARKLEIMNLSQDKAQTRSRLVNWIFKFLAR